MESNELLTMSKQRIAREIKMCQSHIDEENTKRYNLEKQMAAQQAVIDQLNHDLEVANAVRHRSVIIDFQLLCVFLGKQSQKGTSECGNERIRQNKREEDGVGGRDFEKTARSADER